MDTCNNGLRSRRTHKIVHQTAKVAFWLILLLILISGSGGDIGQRWKIIQGRLILIWFF